VESLVTKALSALNCKRISKNDYFIKKINNSSIRNRNQDNHRGQRHDNRYHFTNHLTKDFRRHQDNERSDRNNMNIERNPEFTMMARYDGFMVIASNC
jgi:hypothetical protein